MKIIESTTYHYALTMLDEMVLFAFRVFGFLLGFYLATWIIAYAMVETILKYKTQICQM